MYDLESLIELLLCPFPAVMGPEIIGGLTADGCLKMPEEAARDLVLGKCSGIIGEEPVCTGVIAAVRTAHLYIDHLVVHFPHNLLATSEDGCLGMIEEG